MKRESLDPNRPPLRGHGSSPLIGAHESIAGGIHTAFERGKSVGCRTLQIFTKNNNQWSARPLTDEDVANYKTAEKKASIGPVVAHACYLINLCSTNKKIAQKSRAALVDELRRCEMLGIPYLNFHPGNHMGSGELDGIERIAESINRAHEQTPGIAVLSVLETTAGQGSAIGYRFEHLRATIDRIEEPERMAVCIDTCHIFAAGYDIRTEGAYAKTMSEFDDIVGLQRLVAIHANDSRKELGSRVDRHEHIGRGAIGLDGFRLIMNDARLAQIPKILETPKDKDLKEDRVNLATLRRLVARSSPGNT